MESLDPAPRRFFLRRWLNRLEVDQATFYAIASRGWQFIAGPVSILVITAFFSPQQQGYFYTFASLMGMQTLVELGLHGVIITLASHEWSRLERRPDGTISGDPAALQRLASLHRHVIRWYAWVALAFFVLCGLGGSWFLDHPQATANALTEAQPLPRAEWLPAWFCLVGINAVLIWAWASTSLLEGCQQMAVVNRVRLFQFVCGSLAVWAGMAAGWGLWVTVLSSAVRLVWDGWLIAIRYQPFWQSLAGSLAQSERSEISWKNEVWPLQWKVAVTGVAGYVAYSLFTPVMYQSHGAVVAGQMGMTWTILTALESAAYAWVHARTPLFGILIARRDWRELDRVYQRLFWISWTVYLMGILGVIGAVAALNGAPFPLAQKLAHRLLPVTPTAILAAAFLLIHAPRCQTLYLRAHKRDPLLVAGVVVQGLIGILVVILGHRFGPTGAAVGLLSVVMFLYVPWWTWIWSTSRRAWHAES